MCVFGYDCGQCQEKMGVHPDLSTFVSCPRWCSLAILLSEQRQNGFKCFEGYVFLWNTTIIINIHDEKEMCVHPCVEMDCLSWRLSRLSSLVLVTKILMECWFQPVVHMQYNCDLNTGMFFFWISSLVTGLLRLQIWLSLNCFILARMTFVKILKKEKKLKYERIFSSGTGNPENLLQ